MPSPASNLDWLYHLLGYSLAAAGLLLLLWSLFWDRSRGRRRCPKCWYDMSGTPGLRCSECGRQAKGERRLHRIRRRKWALLPAVLILFGAYVTWSVPRLRQDGWTGLVPSTFLVFAAPLHGSSHVASWSANPTPADRNAMLRVRSPGSGNVAGPAYPITDELWSRLFADKLAPWQTRIFLRRIAQIESAVRVPSPWPIGMDIPFRANPTLATDFGAILSVYPQGAKHWVNDRLPAATKPGRGLDIGLDVDVVGVRPTYSTTKRLPTIFRESRETLLTRTTSQTSTDLVRAELAPHLAMLRGEPHIILHDRPDRQARVALPFIASYTLEVRIDDRVIGSGSGCVPWELGAFTNWFVAPIHWEPGAQAELLSGRAKLTVRGDPAAAAEAFLANPFARTDPECWAGTFSVPLTLGTLM